MNPQKQIYEVNKLQKRLRRLVGGAPVAPGVMPEGEERPGKAPGRLSRGRSFELVD